MLQLDILRHGETVLSHTLRGHTDDELTVQGWRQMQATVASGLQQPILWQVIVSSPLKRCAQFAEQLAAELQLPLMYESGFKEMHFGDWEARPSAEIYAQSPELLANFWQQPTRFSPPNGEKLADFQLRVLSAIEQLKQQMLHQVWSHALLVSHGGVIKLLKCLAQAQALDDILTMKAELGQLNTFRLQAHTETIEYIGELA